MPKVCVTGDVHHYLGNHDLERKEYQFAEKYQEILEDYGACSTLFVTGKCVDQHPDFWEEFYEKYDVELAGHDYWALRPYYLIGIWRKLFGEPGPGFYQRMSIEKTLEVFDKIGYEIESWRSHSYVESERRFNMLSELGIRNVSSIYGREEVRMIGNIVFLPINVYEDSKIFTSIYSDYDEERERKKVVESIEEAIEDGEDIIMQLHPSSMWMNDFKTLKNVLQMLVQKDYEFLKVKEMAKEFRSQRD
ncbi:MAG: hypothetical protein ACLFM9_04005 [Candidatus Aenigmatarchaeota archaeon]